jgi:hypothetical protein
VVPRLARWFDERPITGDACLAALLLVAFYEPWFLTRGVTAVASELVVTGS